MTILTAARPLQKTQSTAVIHEFPERIGVDHYHEMIKTGILRDGDPIELLEGFLTQKARKSPPHSAVTGLIREALRRLITSDWYIDSQEPITTTDSEPEPDVAVIRGDILQYVARHPGPEESALVVEVADTTLRRDRGRKKRLYARAGIPIYWIVNLIKMQIEVYSEPDQQAAEPDYRQRRLYRGADKLPVLLDGMEVGQLVVNDLLPPQLTNKSKG
jgi:Uma2 family endonuclease